MEIAYVTSQRWEEGVTITDLTYASPMGGRVPATLVVPELGVFCLAALAGMIVTYPFRLWMLRRGLIAWGLTPAAALPREMHPPSPCACLLRRDGV